MRGWENMYKVRVTYGRGTTSIYRIYFRERGNALAWLMRIPRSYKVKGIEQS